MTNPYPYQIKGARTIHQFGGRCLVAWEQGTGKSLTSLLYAIRHPDARPVVIVCPASLKWNWEYEAAHHFGIRVEVLEGTKPEKRPLLAKPKFIVVNYDILYAWIDFLHKIKPQLVILDETQALGSLRSRRTKATRKLCLGVPKVLALSGTPLTNRPAELFPTLNILRPDLFPSWHSYAHRHCSPRRAPWGWTFTGASHLPELHAKLTDNLMTRLRKEDVLKDLPEKRRGVILTELSSYKEYKQAHSDFLGWLKATDPAKVLRASKAQAIVQIGYLKRLVGVLKLPNVLEWADGFLEESGEKLILFAVHRKVITAIKERYANQCVVIDGSVSGRMRQLAVRKFQTQKKCRVFIGNIKAAGSGLTLTAASTLAFAELGWTPGEHSQVEARPHRIGATKTVDIRYFIAKNTIEEKLIKLIQSKQKVLNATIDGQGKGDDFDVADQLLREMMKEAKG